METKKVAVVTGAASGIGRGLARIADERGMQVVIADVDEAGLASLGADLHGRPLSVVTDVSDTASVAALAHRVFGEFGRTDLLFNNAGLLSGGLSWKIPTDRWRRILDVNVMGVVNGVASFVPRMIESNLACRIVNTASIGGFLSSPLIAPYTASKFAVVALSEALAVELQLENSRVAVSVLAPGAVRSEIYADTRGAGSEVSVDRSISAMRDFTEQTGMEPEDFARWAFAGIDAGQFWLIMQPEIYGSAIADRTRRALEGINPLPTHYGGATADPDTSKKAR
ncbi:SDR family oxidoreductase [Sphingobium sp. EM0848]|uniref:SDR family oxidoreductase n=1 Tax=Sphingobium sp. EM0848 TaxID=2743473 RepID=UPI00159C8C32|nr:SDR family NAD(P)-dependent oxidoreductase [Sphingobium sp. EM0848]